MSWGQSSRKINKYPTAELPGMYTVYSIIQEFAFNAQHAHSGVHSSIVKSMGPPLCRRPGAWAQDHCCKLSCCSWSSAQSLCRLGKHYPRQRMCGQSQTETTSTDAPKSLPGRTYGRPASAKGSLNEKEKVKVKKKKQNKKKTKESKNKEGELFLIIRLVISLLNVSFVLFFHAINR